ncbi:MAG: cobalt-precorrin 5A hydrolase [Methanobacteriaceae archaeon]|nr:cobalt-precorrin 5A hydrolase [Methanobacteriaceae archaeon]
MKITIISVTEFGLKLSNQIKEKLIKDPTIIEIKQYHKNVKQVIESEFNKTDCIIGIMATGILVRSIAPFVKSKLTDPAVLSIGDDGKFVISLLSGHFGNANNLTSKISKLINSTEVITTSTDINNKIGIDSLAKKYYYNITPSCNIKYINKALINNESVDINLPPKYSYLNDLIPSYYNISNDNNDFYARVNDKLVYFKPLTITMGIGARKNISYDKVFNAINSACKILKIPIQRIDQFATVDIKKDEKGILNVINSFNKPLKIVSSEDIKKFNNIQCSKSDFVMKKFGIKGVCEPSCLIASDNINSELIFKKTAFNGVTIAVCI